MRTYFFLFLAIIVSVPLALHGQTNNTFVPLQPGVPGIKEFATSNSIPDLLNNIYKICIGVAATLAVFQIMRAGILYMGGDSITEKKEAKSLIGTSIAGLILVLSPYILFSIINPDILKLDIGSIKLAPAKGITDPASESSGPATQCTAYKSNPQIKNAGATCDASKGYEKISNTCCKGIAEGGVCCGQSIITTTPDACSSPNPPAICKTKPVGTPSPLDTADLSACSKPNPPLYCKP